MAGSTQNKNNSEGKTRARATVEHVQQQEQQWKHVQEQEHA
jgi:hypothetical protein